MCHNNGNLFKEDSAMPQIIEIQPTLQVMEQKRIELQEYALLNGVSNPTTIQMSQELDKLINEFTQQKAT